MTRRVTTKKLLAGLLALAMLLAYFPAFAWNTYADDVQEAAIEIEGAEGLVNFAAEVNAGELNDRSAVLTADIDLSELEDDWVGIGTEEYPFIGLFNGNGYSITGLKGTQGLFGHVKDACITDVLVYGVVASEEGNDLGGIVGCVEASSTDADPTYIGNVANYATVTSTNGHNVGGILGHVAQGAKVEISFSVNKGSVKGYEYAGGIAGRNQGTLTVETCYNDGRVEATRDNLTQQTNDSNAGGICGSACTIKDSYNSGSVFGHHRSRGGGGQIVERGYAYTPGTPTIDTCYCLEDSAARSTGADRNRPPFTGEAGFTDGTVQKGLNAYYEVGDPWIEGSKVKVDAEAEPQRYPGLSWEMTDDIEILKPIFIEELKNYKDPDDYAEVQQEILVNAVSTGIEAIGLATDSASVVLAFNDATAAIDDIPTAQTILEALDELVDYIADKEYYDSQEEKIDAIMDDAGEKIAAAATVDELSGYVTDAMKAIDAIPDSEEVDDANAAKLKLRELIVRAKSLIAAGDYEKDGMIALNAALDTADEVYYNLDAFELDVAIAYDAIWEALHGLVVSNNKAMSELLLILISAKEYDETLYTPDSYEPLASAIQKADAAVLDPKTPAGKCRALETELLTAINGLVIDEAAAAAAAEAAAKALAAAELAEAKTQLRYDMINANLALQTDVYTRDSVTAVRNAIAAAGLVYENVEATLAQVIEADDALQKALLGLKASNAKAKGDLAAVMYELKYIDKDIYTEASYTALEEVVLVANEVLADPDAPIGRLENVRSQLIQAIDNLVIDEEAAAAKAEAAAKELAAEELAEAKEALRKDMVKANLELQSGAYSKTSGDALRAAIATAKTVYDNVEATLAQVIEANDALQNAALALEGSTDAAKADLLTTLNRVTQTVNKNDYTTSSYTALQNAYNAAKNLAKNPKATIEELSSAKINVLSAQNDLVKKAANPMKVSKKNKSVKRVKLLVKDQVVKAISVKKAVGKVSFKKMEGSGKFKVNSSNGKITVKKGTKKGTYLLKIRVRAAGNGNYQAAEKIVSVKIAVK